MEHVPLVVRLLAQGLCLLHNIAITACPFADTIGTRLELARQCITYQLLDSATFSAEFQGMHPQEVYKLALELRPCQEHVVLIHGDYCLPNVLLERSLSRVNDFVDWGRGGLAAAYQDLALAARSLACNFGE